MPIGGVVLDLTGVPLPEEILYTAKQSDAILLGAIGGYKWDKNETHLGSDFKGLKKIGYVDVDGGFNGASRRIFSLRESDFNGMDDSSFIDLKLDYSKESKSNLNFSDVKMSFSKSVVGPTFGSMRDGHEFVGDLMRDGFYSHGGSCRITVNDRGGIKKGRKNFKGWR